MKVEQIKPKPDSAPNRKGFKKAPEKEGTAESKKGSSEAPDFIGRRKYRAVLW